LILTSDYYYAFLFKGDNNKLACSCPALATSHTPQQQQQQQQQQKQQLQQLQQQQQWRRSVAGLLFHQFQYWYGVGCYSLIL
jgi:hypothetical protein